MCAGRVWVGFPMIRRALTVLLAALGMACASATGFTEAPHTKTVSHLDHGALSYTITSRGGRVVASAGA
jgi:hypothetical protein